MGDEEKLCGISRGLFSGLGFPSCVSSEQLFSFIFNIINCRHSTLIIIITMLEQPEY